MNLLALVAQRVLSASALREPEVMEALEHEYPVLHGAILDLKRQLEAGDQTLERPGAGEDVAEWYLQLRACLLANGGRLELTGAQLQDARRHGMTTTYNHETGGQTLSLFPPGKGG